VNSDNGKQITENANFLILGKFRIYNQYVNIYRIIVIFALWIYTEFHIARRYHQMTSKAKFFILIIAIGFSECYSQQYKKYTGTVGSYPITMHLNVMNNDVIGMYFYDRIGEPIELSGRISENTINLNEYFPVIGQWGSQNGASISFNQVSGKGNWKSKEKKFELILYEEQLDFQWNQFQMNVEWIHTFNGN